jgi:hypothetical protein
MYPTGSTTNLAATSLTGDKVFSDGSTTQPAGATGDTISGYVATLQVGTPV